MSSAFGRTRLDGLEEALEPIGFVARTVNENSLLGLRPFTVIGLLAGLRLSEPLSQASERSQ
jgi:hypothetical protein